MSNYSENETSYIFNEDNDNIVYTYAKKDELLFNVINCLAIGDYNVTPINGETTFSFNLNVVKEQGFHFHSGVFKNIKS